MVKRWQRFKAVDVSNHCPFKSKKEFIDDWFTDYGWSRSRRPSKISQLPSPDVATQPFSRAATSSSQRSTASVHETDYRQKLEQYNIYVPGESPPPELRKEVERIVFRQRETPELDDAVIDEIRIIIKDLQNKGEDEVRNKLGARIIPGYRALSDERLEVVHGQLWNKAVPVPPGPECS